MKNLIFTILLCLLSFPAFSQQTESVYERVTNSGKLRCAYFIWPPMLDRDINTGAFSGLFYDLVEEIGAQLDLEIVWAEEVAWASIFEGYASGRFDMICGPLYMTPSRARGTDFTMEIFYTPNYLYARSDDTRFDENYEAANDPSITIATIDGEFSQVLAREHFPKATAISSMGLTDGTQPLLDVITGKADVAPQEPVIAHEFSEKNPGKIKRVKGDPLVLFPVGMSVPPDEYKFKRMIDITLKNLHDKGYVDQLLTKYLPAEVHFYRVHPGYMPEGGKQ